MYFFTFLTTTCDPAFTVNSITPTLRINDALKCAQFYFLSLRIRQDGQEDIEFYCFCQSICRPAFGALKSIIFTGKGVNVNVNLLLLARSQFPWWCE